MDGERFADVVVRRAAYSDAAALCDMWLGLLRHMAALDRRLEISEDAARRWHADFSVWLRDDGRRILVAEVDGMAAGYVSCRLAWPLPVFREVVELYLDELYVVPQHRRKGLGRRLVEEVTAWSVQHGVRRLRLQTLNLAADSRSFWTALGAQPFAVEYVVEVPAADEKGMPGIP